MLNTYSTPMQNEIKIGQMCCNQGCIEEFITENIIKTERPSKRKVG
jgi:hypothetical protein